MDVLKVHVPMHEHCILYRSATPHSGVRNPTRSIINKKTMEVHLSYLSDFDGDLHCTSCFIQT